MTTTISAIIRKKLRVVEKYNTDKTLFIAIGTLCSETFFASDSYWTEFVEHKNKILNIKNTTNGSGAPTGWGVWGGRRK
jgi:hypothetical protein